MKSALHLSRIALLPLLALGAIACAKQAEETQKTSWECSKTAVPMGEVVRCSQSALTMDGPATGTSEPCTGVDDNPDVCSDSTDTSTSSSYDCTAGDVDCPTGEGAGEAGEPVISGTGGAGGEADSDTESSSDFGGATPPSGGAGSAPGKSGCTHGNGAKSDRDFGGSGPGQECSYVPDLPYCGGAAGSSDTSGGTTDSTSDSSTSSTAPSSDKGSASAPGQQKKNGGATTSGTSSPSSGSTSDSGTSSPTTSGSSSSSGSPSTGSSGKGGTRYKCVKDKKGNKTCTSVPACVPGTHPSACGACVPDGDTCDCVPPSQGGCWVTGGGFIVGPNLTNGAAPDGHDNFGGNAKPMKDGRIQGHWNHVDHGTMNHAKGKPEYLVCRHVDEPGPGQPGGKKGFTMNQVYFGGPAEWRTNGTWESGYWFDVVAKDHGEPGSVPSPKNGFMVDTYHFTIRKMDDPAKKISGAIVYETKGGLEGGNIQLHPPNGGHPYTPMSLPGWVQFEP